MKRRSFLKLFGLSAATAIIPIKAMSIDTNNEEYGKSPALETLKLHDDVITFKDILKAKEAMDAASVPIDNRYIHQFEKEVRTMAMHSSKLRTLINS